MLGVFTRLVDRLMLRKIWHFSQIVWRRPNQLPIRHNLYTTPDIVPVKQELAVLLSKTKQTSQKPLVYRWSKNSFNHNSHNTKTTTTKKKFELLDIHTGFPFFLFFNWQKKNPKCTFEKVQKDSSKQTYMKTAVQESKKSTNTLIYPVNVQVRLPNFE